MSGTSFDFSDLFRFDGHDSLSRYELHFLSIRDNTTCICMHTLRRSGVL